MGRFYDDDHACMETEFQEWLLETGFTDLFARYVPFGKARNIDTGFVRLAVLPDSFEPHPPRLDMVREKGCLG
jgi:hypothetical protein